MLVKDFLPEDTNSDLSFLRQAKDAETKMYEWFMKNNEDKTIRDLFKDGILNVTQVDGEYIYYISATAMGIDAADLYIGIGKRLNGSISGKLVTSIRKNQPLYFLVMYTIDDPMDKVDVAYGFQSGTFIHEYIHYLDHKRENYSRKTQKTINNLLKDPTYIPKGHKYKNAEEYYNNPLEFNAHWHQGVVDILSQLIHFKERGSEVFLNHSINKSFNFFSDFALPKFPKSFYIYLNPVYKKKFDKRLYALYTLLHNHFPDIDYIKQEIANREEIDRKFNAQDQSL